MGSMSELCIRVLARGSLEAAGAAMKTFVSNGLSMVLRIRAHNH